MRVAPEKAAQLAELLSRHGQLAFEQERLQRLGLWWLTVEDPDYPRLLSERLGDGAPPSCSAWVAASSSAVTVWRWSAHVTRRASCHRVRPASGSAGRTPGLALVSGAARGVDAESMRGAFDAGGRVLGVTPDGLERYLRDASLRSAFAEGQATYLSPYRPDARFSVGSAMGRNKLVYCLASAGLVAHTSADSGGTWAGAVEALKHRWVPVLVNADAEVAKGNQALIERGGQPVRADDLADLPALVARVRLEPVAAAGEKDTQQTLFDGQVKYSRAWPSRPEGSRCALRCQAQSPSSHRRNHHRSIQCIAQQRHRHVYLFVTRTRRLMP